MLKLIVESAAALMQGKAACLFLAKERQDLFVPMAQTGLSDTYLQCQPDNRTQTESCAGQNRLSRFLDATSDPRLENHEAKKAEGIASLLTVPVRVKNRNGILTLYTAVRREFQPEEIEFLCALADQGGISIENNRLQRRMQKNAMLFLELAASINSSLDIHRVLNNLTANICEKLGMRGAVIRLLDDDRNELKLVASHGLSEGFLEKTSTTLTQTAQRALKGETLIIRDTRN